MIPLMGKNVTGLNVTVRIYLVFPITADELDNVSELNTALSKVKGLNYDEYVDVRVDEQALK